MKSEWPFVRVETYDVDTDRKFQGRSSHIIASCSFPSERVWYQTGEAGCFLANGENGVLGQLLTCDERLGVVVQFCSAVDCSVGCGTPKVLSGEVSELWLLFIRSVALK